MADANGRTDDEARRKVTDVCRMFLTSGDAGLAQRLQNEEYDKKHEWNRETRKNARIDVPLAKTEQELEEEKLQKERFEFLQKQTKLSEEDERIAMKLHQDEQLNKQQKSSLAEKDAEVALQLQREEERRKVVADNSIQSNDAKIALEMQKEEILEKERNRIKLEMEDQALAQMFQEQERQLVEMKTMERDLREERRLLELELLNEVQTEELVGRGPQNRNFNRPTVNRDTVAILAGGSGGYQLSDIGFLTDEERHEIMKMQDEELARALQEHEEKKARRARREIAADIEQRDYQLARIMQEVEKLELAKRMRQEQGGTYIIVPVAHGAMPVVSSASYVNSRRDDGRSTTTRSVTNSVNTSHANVSANNDTVRMGSSSSSGASSSPRNHFPPAALPPRPAPPQSTSPTPTLSASTAAHGPSFASVAHTRVTETSVTSQTASSSHDNSRPTPNNQAGPRTSSVTEYYQDAQSQAYPRRQNSRDKSCRQQ